MYIVLEGLAGVGKSTQHIRLIKHLRVKYPTKKFISSREPGGTPKADDIREIAQAKEYSEPENLIGDILLYAASRAQTLVAVVWPFLKEGAWVIVDRSFISSLVIQGIGYKGGIKNVWEINRQLVMRKLPDLVLYLKLNPKVAKSRVHDPSGDKHERNPLAFYESLVKGYDEVKAFLLQELGLKIRWETIDASGTEDQVFQRILAVIEPLLEET